MADQIGGIVLCGGQSRRMGTPKAWLPIGADYLLQRVVRIVGEVVDPVVVAARPRQSIPPLPPGVDTVYDAVENAGPLAGLAAGLAHLAERCDAVFVVSCDHPLISPPFVRRLIDLLGDAPAVVPSHEDHTYPLVALYRVTVHAIIADMLAHRQLLVREFAQRCGARFVLGSDLAEADPALASLRNVNDPESYRQILQELEG
ncbi:MAG: molybdenum cofactor guanylyltransferase [Planctomycetota bacterium]